MAFRSASLALVPVLALAACNSGAPPQVIAVEDLGPLGFPKVVRSRNVGFSIGWQGQSVWVFGDTILGKFGEDGRSRRSSTWSHAPLGDSGAMTFTEPLDSRGVPREFLPFSLEETNYNDAHMGPSCKSSCGNGYSLWPGPVVDRGDGTMLVFYSKIAMQTGAFGAASLGTGLAAWSSAVPYTQPVRQGGILFATDPGGKGGDPQFGSGAVASGGMVYAFACNNQLVAPCLLGRASLESAFVRQEWRFWNGSDYVADLTQAQPVFDGAPYVDVHWNPHLRSWLATYSVPERNMLALRSAPALEGPWSDELGFFETSSPEGTQWNYSGLGHAELMEQNGKVEYVSYFEPGTEWKGLMPLVRIEFL